jgi:hypothetical protein
MSFEQISYLTQIVASIGVVVSLIFVGLQIRQNTRALQRTEHNSTMEQWTVIRQAIAQNRDIAELMTAGLRGERALDAADQLRLEQMLQENAWASFHIWDRTQRGIFPKGTFEATAGALLCTLLRTPGGDSWWSKCKRVGFDPRFVLNVDAVLRRHQSMKPWQRMLDIQRAMFDVDASLCRDLSLG